MPLIGRADERAVSHPSLGFSCHVDLSQNSGHLQSGVLAAP